MKHLPQTRDESFSKRRLSISYIKTIDLNEGTSSVSTLCFGSRVRTKIWTRRRACWKLKKMIAFYENFGFNMNIANRALRDSLRIYLILNVESIGSESYGMRNHEQLSIPS